MMTSTRAQLWHKISFRNQIYVNFDDHFPTQKCRNHFYYNPNDAPGTISLRALKEFICGNGVTQGSSSPGFDTRAMLTVVSMNFLKLNVIKKLPALHGFVSLAFLLHGTTLHVAGKEPTLHGVTRTCCESHDARICMENVQVESEFHGFAWYSMEDPWSCGS